MAERIRIKDIAERAGVSVGTVDRVLHDRPNVSKPAREKVEQALKEMNYQPNMYASALAYNKAYTFCLLIPKHESEAYWEEIEEGARKCEDQRRDFHIDLEIRFYERSNEDSFKAVSQEILDANPEGVIVVPSSLEETRGFTDQLHQKGIPFILLDSYMPDLRPLSFYGQDSFCSGFFAAKMLMMLAGNEKEVMLMRQTKDGHVVSKQQDNREVGFRHYMHDHFPQIVINVLDLPLNGTRNEYQKMLGQYFDEHPATHHCITLTSKAHIVEIICLSPIAVMYRSWVMIWWARMRNVCAKAVSRSSSHSMPICRATIAWIPLPCHRSQEEGESGELHAY